MNFEQIQLIISGMLDVQRGIQESQLKSEEKIASLTDNMNGLTDKMDDLTDKMDRLTDRVDLLTENIENLNVISQRHEDRLTYLYGYDMSQETNMLNTQQEIINIKRRLTDIEQKLAENGES